MSIMNEDGQVTDKRVDELGIKIAKEVADLFKSNAEHWSTQDTVIATYHLQSYISTELMRFIVGKAITKQQASGKPLPTLKPQAGQE